jgi:hypothetical protein
MQGEPDTWEIDKLLAFPAISSLSPAVLLPLFNGQNLRRPAALIPTPMGSYYAYREKWRFDLP